jgi:murein DD-endopeptidase MepM/ murein hydrolase activator NlpD
MNKKKKKSSKFKNKLVQKYRLVVENSENFEKLYQLKLSRLNVFVYGGFFSIFLIGITSLIIAYTPLKEYIPGYESSALKKQARNLMVKVDSLEKHLRVNDIKLQALIPILSGEESVDMSQFEDVEALMYRGELDLDSTALQPSQLDLAFRQEVDREDRYSIFEEAVLTEDIVFFAPVTGVISNAFDADKKHFAVDIVVKNEEPVKAAADGVVVFAEWTTETGYVIIVGHNNGYLSVYKHNQTLTKEQGDLVRSGEVIAMAGSTGDLSSGTHLHFELWNNGFPVDPSNLMDFE